MKRSALVFGLIAAISSGSVLAQNFGIAAQAGTTGIALQGGMGINDSFGLRLTLNTFSQDKSGTESNVSYDATADLRSGGLFADWYPFQGGFRVSTGLFLNKNEINLTGNPSGGTYDINGTTYQASDLGSLTGKLDYGQKVAPYLGLGWGHLGKKSGLSFMADVGVLFTGEPDVALNGTCNPALPVMTCDQLQADIAAEQAQLKDDLGDASFWPVISLGIGYTF